MSGVALCTFSGMWRKTGRGGANSCLVHEPATTRRLLPAAVAVGGGLGWYRPCTMSRCARPGLPSAGLGCSNAFEGYGVGFRWPCPNFWLGDWVPVLGPWRQGTQFIGLQFKVRGAPTGCWLN